MTDLRLPPERFFFALLDTSALPPAGASRRRQQLDALFEVTLPIPVEEVQTQYLDRWHSRRWHGLPARANSPRHAHRWRGLSARANSRRHDHPAHARGEVVLACGIARDHLREHADNHPHALTLGPDALPPRLCTQLEQRGLAVPEPVQFNLLTGDFEPPAVRHARRRSFVHAAAAICLLTLILAIGLHRRTLALHKQAAATDDQVEQVYAQVLPDLPTGRSRHAAITSELRRLRQTRRPDQRDILPIDPTPTLAALLETWPADLPAQTQSLSANESTLAINTSLASHADAERLIDALAPPDGLRAIQPTVRTDRDRVHLDLRFQREAQR